MKLKPLGHRVLIDPNFDDGTIKEGALKGFEFTNQSIEQERGATQTGKIVAIGPNAWKDFPPGNPWAAVDDLVYFAKYAHKVVKGDQDKEYWLINDEDCMCKIDEEEPDFLDEEV